LACVGASDCAAERSLVRIETEGLSAGWLACARTWRRQPAGGARYWELDEEELVQTVRRCRRAADVLIVSLHAGFMFLDYPHPRDILLADRLLDAGASLLLMHHAHVLQGARVSPSGGIACFSLGNFLLDPSEGYVAADRASASSAWQREGAVFLFEIDRDGIARAAALPTFIDHKCAVRWARGERGLRALERLRRISLDLGGDCSGLFARQRAERAAGHGLRVLWFHMCRLHLRETLRILASLRLEHIPVFARWAMGRVRRRRDAS
jgi:hypothetical protein